MFIAIVDVHPKKGLESDFTKWFTESNKVAVKFDGLVSRRLLRTDDNSYRIIVEHASKETFESMHKSQEHAKMHAVAVTFMERPPTPRFYDVVVG